MHLQPGEALERRDALAGQVGHQIHLALFQGAQPVVVGGNGLVNDGIGITRKTAGIPPVRVALQLQRQAGGPAFGHAIGAGAVGVSGGITTAAGPGSQYGLGSVGPCPASVHDPCIGQDTRQQRHRFVQHDVDGVLVDASHAAHAGQHGAQRAAGAFQALQRELHVFGRERAAVMKAHALAQVEAPDDRGEQFPALGQRRFDLQPGRVAGQRLVDVLQHGLDLRMGLRMRIQRGDLGLGRPAQRGRAGGQGSSHQAGQQQGTAGLAQPGGPPRGQ